MPVLLALLLLFQTPQDLTLTVEASCSPNGWTLKVADPEPGAEYVLTPVLADMPGGTYFQPYVDYGADAPQFIAFKVRKTGSTVENLASSNPVSLPPLNCSGSGAATTTTTQPTTTTTTIGSQVAGAALPAQQLPYTGPREILAALAVAGAGLLVAGGFLAAWFRKLRIPGLRAPRDHW